MASARFTAAQRRARLARRHHLAGGVSAGASVETVTASLVGLHSTDPATPYMSLWARLPDFTVVDLDDALYERHSLVKQLAMRRTLWMVRTEDLSAVQVAASERVAANETRRLVADAEKAGVAADGAAWLETAAAAVIDHLRTAGPCTARQLREALPELTGTHDPAPGKHYGGEGHLAPRVLTVLAARGELVRGPNDGGWTSSRPRWTTAAQWLPPATAVEPNRARAELVRRWLHAFGPATVNDLKWWFGNTVGWARQALVDVDAVEVDLDGVSGYVLPGDDGPDPEVEPWCALLPGLDVTTMGWADRGWYLDAHREAVFDRNGNGGPTIWVDGRIVGAWTQDAEARVRLVFLEDIDRGMQKTLAGRADALTEWLAGVRVSPRFPSPACKSIAVRR
ncbi:winged helix DNA-binding domain-containing protein [Mycobacterium sp. pV006]|uniref:winged helix DNA-binding domain-containing protein n=1 Tax=Mycobacterium sp. pV006 TaxID=3238983 RepID=UPI00351B071D